jgi:hypothetical protein
MGQERGALQPTGLLARHMNFPDYLPDEEMQIFRREVELGGEWEVGEMVFEPIPGERDYEEVSKYDGRKAISFFRHCDEDVGPGISLSTVEKFVFTQNGDGVWIQDPLEVRDEWPGALKHADEYTVPT